MAPNFTERPLVYLAGPYTNPDPVENTHKMVKLADALHDDLPVTVLVPHLSMLWHSIRPHSDIDYWYQYDLALLARCDALFRARGESSGADAEVEFAKNHGIPVFTELWQLLAWAQSQ